jgi:hypothetical protein
MRKFRFIGEPVNSYYLLEKNSIYNANTIVTDGHDDEFGYGWDVLRYAEENPEDWEEIKPLHKDTDLGYFAGVAMQGILQDSNWITNPIEAAKRAVEYSKELIKQLDQEAK